MRVLIIITIYSKKRSNNLTIEYIKDTINFIKKNYKA